MNNQNNKQEEFKKDFNTESSQISNDQLLKKYGFKSVKEMCEYARINNLIINKPLTEEDKKHLNLLADGLKSAMEILNDSHSSGVAIKTEISPEGDTSNLAEQIIKAVELSKEDKAELNLNKVAKYGFIEMQPHKYKPVAINQNKFKWVKK